MSKEPANLRIKIKLNIFLSTSFQFNEKNINLISEDFFHKIEEKIDEKLQVLKIFIKSLKKTGKVEKNLVQRD